MKKSRLVTVLAAFLAVFLIALAGISAYSVKAEDTDVTGQETTVEVAETVEVQEPETTTAPETTTKPEVTAEETTTAVETEPETTAEEVLELADSQNGWVQKNGVWYYYKNNAAVTGWQKISNVWYYFNGSGVMQTGWQLISGKWYFFKSGGAMVTGWQSIKNKWYYFTGSGAMVTDWYKVGTKWYYFNGSGSMRTGWLELDGTWYYLAGSGAMMTGWQKISNKWYFFNGSGAMQTGWIKDGNKWYYMKDSGAMAANEWVKGYYWLGSNGVWSYKFKGSWKSNSKGTWFGDTSGWYAKNTTIVIDGKSYKFDSRGYVVNNDEIMNIAFLGIDVMENRSDVMMVISVNKTQNTISCVSILRDSKVKVPGCSVGTKIGYAYKWGDAWSGEGEALAMQTINNNFGTKIDKYIKMYFWDVEAVVDALGGVDIYVTEEETSVLDGLARSRGYTGEGTHEGMNHLCGLQTVAYSRIRSFGGSLAEFYRSHRQHAVIKEIFKKITKMSKAEQLAFLLDIALQNIDTNISLEDLKSLTDLKMSTLKLECCTIPDGDFETNLRCGWEDTPATQPDDPELDPRQWLWFYDLSEAGGRLRSYTGN